MFTSLSHILVIIETYKYVLIFPIVVVEGPIITVISGFLVYLGYLNIFLLYPLLVVGDLIGDSLYYSIGRYGRESRWLRKLGSYVGYNTESEAKLENHFEKHTGKTLILAKVSHGLGIPVQIAAGMAKVKYSKYLLIELIATVPKTLALLALGYYVGSSYQEINNYFEYFGLIVISIALVVIAFLVLNKYIKNYFK